MVCNFIQKRLQHRCFIVNNCKIANSFFYKIPPVASVNITEWFLLKRFVDLVRVRYLQIIRRNHSKTLFLISLQKTKACSSAAAKAICSDIRILTVQAGFCLLLHVYFSGIQINTLLYLSSSLQKVPLQCELFWKGLGSKNLLQEQITEYRILEIQFRSVDNKLVAKICKNFKQKKATLAVVFKAKAV